jgi:hypothetical protein
MEFLEQKLFGFYIFLIFIVFIILFYQDNG